MCKSWSRSDNVRWKIGPWKKLFAINYQFWMSGCRSPKLRVAEFGQCIFKHLPSAAKHCQCRKLQRWTFQERGLVALNWEPIKGASAWQVAHVQQCIKVQVIPNVESKVVESRERFVVLQTSKETWNEFHATIDISLGTRCLPRIRWQTFDEKRCQRNQKSFRKLCNVIIGAQQLFIGMRCLINTFEVFAKLMQCFPQKH